MFSFLQKLGYKKDKKENKDNNENNYDENNENNESDFPANPAGDPRLLLDILNMTPCKTIIYSSLSVYYDRDHLFLFKLNLVCKALFETSKPAVKEYFWMRYTGSPPFTRTTVTSVILYKIALPNKSSLLSPSLSPSSSLFPSPPPSSSPSPPITRVHLIGYNSDTLSYLPPSVTHLSLSEPTNVRLPPLSLPPSLTHLRFPFAFNSPVDSECLPSSLTHVFFGKNFDRPVSKLPHGIKYLIFLEHFNHPVDLLPPSLVFLATGKRFNQSIDSLPSTLEFLFLGENSSHSINNLPHSITQLNLKGGIPLSNHLPPRLENLKISRQTYPLPPLPSSLMYLSISGAEGATISYPHGNFPPGLRNFTCLAPSDITATQLPSTLKILHLANGFQEYSKSSLARFTNITYISFPKDFNHPVDGYLPGTVENLVLGRNYSHSLNELPSKLKYLYINHEGAVPDLNNLPRKMLYLYITTKKFTVPLQTLPPNLLRLEIRDCVYEFPNLDFMPRHLTSLYIGAPAAPGAVIQNLPSSLESLSLSNFTEQNAFKILSLPPSLTYLSMSGSYNPQGLTPLLPRNLRFLSFGYSFTHKIDRLPPSLTELHLGGNFKHALPPLPPRLRVLKIFNDSYKHKIPYNPRLFHADIRHIENPVPLTCHTVSGPYSFSCDVCLERRIIGFDFMNESHEHWVAGADYASFLMY